MSSTVGSMVRSSAPVPANRRTPKMMNRAAASEIAALHPDAVIVKGNLLRDGTADEWEIFEACYWTPSPIGSTSCAATTTPITDNLGTRAINGFDLPGLTIGLLDTVIPGRTPGGLRPAQLDALDDRLAGTAGPVMLMGHHQQWISSGGDGRRSDDYFGLHPDASDALDEVCARHRHVVGYAAGHTHRHRVRRMARSGVPSIEVGTVKDFPGTWAEYRFYEGGVSQVVHRISSQGALSWSNRCRALYSDFGIDYESYAMGTLEHRCFVLGDR